MAQRDYVTIVSGLPRSGTSMMMKMLEEGGIPLLVDNVRRADEDNPKGYYEFEPVKQTRKNDSWVKDGVGKVVKLVHLILLDLPLTYHYHVVFMRRNIDEVVRSQNVMLERQGKATGDLPEERLKELFLAQIRKVEKYMDDHADNFRFIEVDYNAMLKDPEPEVEKLMGLLEGLDREKMLGVVDPALYRNRAEA